MDRRPTIYQYDRSARETDNSVRLNLWAYLRRLRLGRHEGYLFRDEDIHLVLILPRGSTQEWPRCVRETCRYGSHDENIASFVKFNLLEKSKANLVHSDILFKSEKPIYLRALSDALRKSIKRTLINIMPLHISACAHQPPAPACGSIINNWSDDLSTVHRQSRRFCFLPSSCYRVHPLRRLITGASNW